MKSIWRAVVDALVEEGVERVYGFPGNPRQFIKDLDEGSDIEFVLMRHEASGAAAAFAEARLSGKPAVCFASPGPGAANLVTNLLEATSASLPLIALVTGVENSQVGMGAFQELDIVSLMKPVTKWAERITDPVKTPWTMRRAFQLAVNGRPGAVVVEVPQDMGAVQYEIGEYISGPGRVKSRPDGEAVARAAELLARAEKPIIVCGSGAVYSGAGEKAANLGRLLGAPIMTTPGGRGIIAENDPLALGQVGIYFTEAGEKYYKQADLILSVGSRLEAFSTIWWSAWPDGAKLIQLDVDPEAMAMNWRPDEALAGDAALGLADLNAALTGKVDQAKAEARLAELAALKKDFLARIAAEVAQSDVPLSPPFILAAVNRVFGPDTILVSENGGTDLWSYYWPYYQILTAGCTVPMGEQTAMGLGVVGTIGAKAARPDQKVVCITGDGAFQMGMLELPTAAGRKAGVTWVVFNNGRLGWPQWHQVLGDLPQVGTNFDFNPDLVALAEAQGCLGLRVEKPDEVEPALKKALEANQAGKPVMIDFHTQAHVYSEHFVRMHTDRSPKK